jgi:predicted transposase YbfD/YdcC
LRDQSCMPVPADAAEAVIAEAEETVRLAAAREEARQRRRDRKGQARRRRQEDLGRKAAGQRERLRAQEERLRAVADEARGVLLERAADLAEASGGSVPDCFAAVPDPRNRRGRRHSLPCVLTLVVTAMLHGKTKLSDITAWIAHAGQDIRAAAGARAGGNGRRQAPCGKTVTRLLGLTGAQGLADAAAGYLSAALPAEPAVFPVKAPALRPSLACDGKEARGAIRADGTSLFLLSAAAGGIVPAEREIAAKTNEVPEIGPMLLELNERVPLAGRVITADALRTQVKFADMVCGKLLAHYVLTVKGNQPGLLAALEQLTWAGARRHVTEDEGHGRRERRAHLVMDAPEGIKALFPHARQIARVIRTRTVTRRKGNGKTRTRITETHTGTVYLVTSLSAREAAPEHIAAYVRGHWSMENEVHLVRDVTLREDSSKVRAGSRPRALATLRNLTMGLIRQDGHQDIAATIRDAEYDNALIMALLRLTSHL